MGRAIRMGKAEICITDEDTSTVFDIIVTDWPLTAVDEDRIKAAVARVCSPEPERQLQKAREYVESIRGSVPPHVVTDLTAILGEP
jgi:hypothetical protein